MTSFQQQVNSDTHRGKKAFDNRAPHSHHLWLKYGMVPALNPEITKAARDPRESGPDDETDPTLFISAQDRN